MCIIEGVACATPVACANVVVWHAQVKDWGGGEPADLGELQVESFSPGLYADHSKPFYEQLARRLEDLQVRSMISRLSLCIILTSASF